MDLTIAAKSLEKVHTETNLANHGKRRLRARNVIGSPAFDYAMGAIIIFNFCIMIVETDRTADGEEPTSSFHWSEIAGWCILVAFILELALRLYALRLSFFESPWNVFDCVVVVTDTLSSFLSLAVGRLFPSATLRIFRLAKLARVAKVLRVFPELRTMIAGLIGSISAIFWGSVLLLFFLVVWAMAAVIFVHPLLKNLEFEECERCARAFDSVGAATLTLCQTVVAGDAWAEISIPLIEKHPVTAIFFALVHLTVAMGVLNLILGVVCNVFQIARDRIVEEMEEEKLMKKLEMQNHLLQLCKDMDLDGSGELTRDEIEEGYRDREDFRNTVQSLDVSESDLSVVWTILDNDKSDKVSYLEFVSQIYKMQSSDTHFMLAYIKYYVTMIKDTILEQMKESEMLVKNTQETFTRGVDLFQAEEERFRKDFGDLNRIATQIFESASPSTHLFRGVVGGEQTQSADFCVHSEIEAEIQNDFNANELGKSANLRLGLSDRSKNAAFEHGNSKVGL